MNHIAINARLGDGMVHFRGKNACFSMQSKNLDWLTVKRDICLKEGFNPQHIVIKKSGYTGELSIYTFTTLVNEKITEVYKAEMPDILSNLTKEDLCFWYLDDGSYQKNRYIMHLYCNQLNEDESEVLISRIYQLYGIYPTKRYDRKKDDRSFIYLYFPRELTEIFRKDVEKILVKYKVKSLFYKIGEARPLRFKSIKED